MRKTETGVYNIIRRTRVRRSSGSFDGKREAFFGDWVVGNEEMQKMETKKRDGKMHKKKTVEQLKIKG